METIIYKTMPSKRFYELDYNDEIYMYYNQENPGGLKFFVHHLDEDNKSEYKYFVPTDHNSGIFFVKEIDAVNFAANSYQYGVSKAWFSMGEYSEAHNYVFSDSKSL